MDLGDLGTDRLTWGRLARLIRAQPYTSASALAWAKTAQGGAYPIDVELLAGSYDAARVANWQRSKDAARPGTAPKPVKRPNRTEALRGEAREELIRRGEALLARQRPMPRHLRAVPG